MRILLIVIIFIFSYIHAQSLLIGPDETPLKGKELLRKSLPDFKDIDAVAELIAEQRKKVQQRLSHGQQEVDKEMSELIEEAKKLNPKPLPPDAPRSIAEINTELGLDEVLVEGDMLMSLEEAKRHFGLSPSRHRSKRQAYQGWDFPASLWKNGVYYGFEGLNRQGINAVENAIAFWQKHTCVRFHRANGGYSRSSPILLFYPSNGCFSRIGRDSRSSRQYVSIGRNCEHADMRFNYDKTDKAQNNNHGKQYDFRGIMHYFDTAFSVDNRRTVMYTRNKMYQMSLGGEPLPTYGDIFEMNTLYSCYDRCKNSGTVCKNEGRPNPNNCGVCQCPSGFGGRDCSQRQPPSHGLRCGETLSATGSWKTLSISNVVGNGQWNEANRSDPYHCTWHVKAPAGKRIKFNVNYVGASSGRGETLCRPRCYFGGLSIKGIEKTWIPEGMRVCCSSQFNKPQTTASNLLIIQPWNALLYTDFKVQYMIVGGSGSGGGGGSGSTPSTRSTRRPTSGKCRYNNQILSSDGSRCYTLYAYRQSYQGANSVCRGNGRGSISMSQSTQDEAKLREMLSDKGVRGYWHGKGSNGACGIYVISYHSTSYVHCKDSSSYAAFICEAPSVR
ncbi:hypothetical protein QR680_015363 [Steinernema hermaphroditum]|uniref:Metalloendopeptidase n=1 Tax=Steinernema hermaphroditum TaxID=289476 RepID=A0AA39LKQ3_9BILA|nr:hypothetical protein QR680_015363 [Steinernema hermaphroditum]